MNIMSRPLRIEYEGALYLVTARGNEQKGSIFPKLIMEKYTSKTNFQIGQIFNGLTFSAVAKVYHRMSKAVEENRTLRKKVGKIISALS